MTTDKWYVTCGKNDHIIYYTERPDHTVIIEAGPFPSHQKAKEYARQHYPNGRCGNGQEKYKLETETKLYGSRCQGVGEETKLLHAPNSERKQSGFQNYFFKRSAYTSNSNYFQVSQIHAAYLYPIFRHTTLANKYDIIISK